MANLYHVPELPEPGPATLEGDVGHHLVRVLRVRPGDEVLLCDGRGRTTRAVIVSTGRREVAVDVGPATAHQPPCPSVLLAFACPRPARADWLIEHGTEVGVAAFQAIWTERSRPQQVRVDRWRKIAAAAAGQCARPHLPDVREPLELGAFLASALPARRLLAAGDGGPLEEAGDPLPAAVLIGPEGGFTPTETDSIAAAGFVATSLGPHSLRTETAALVSAALLLQAARR
ncbi:MAG: RsmE family RNA methyltransferase [Planctomycetota bacterium]|nr:RsmE family RNA methyltransferase [Planctomycetota bacterium]